MKSLKEQLKPVRQQARPAKVLPLVTAAPAPAEIDFPLAVAGTRPLKPDGRIQHPLPKPKPRRLQHHHHGTYASLPHESVFAQMLGWFEPAGMEVQHRQPGLQSNILRKLKAGHWPVCAELDLHGLDRFEAHERLALFLHRARRLGQCVRIIHGKGLSSRGEPVLPKMVRAWLTHHPDVLAFCETAHHQGGSGAVLALLKRTA